LTMDSTRMEATRNLSSIIPTVSPDRACTHPKSDRLSREEVPAFVLERRGQHKPLRSYFTEDVLDREGSVDREVGSHRSDGTHGTQEGTKQTGEANNTAGSSSLQIPPSLVHNSTAPDDEDSVTGKTNFSHQLMHYVDVTSTESETEADFEAFFQAVAKRKCPVYSEPPSKRQKLSVDDDDDDSVTESDDDGPCMCTLESHCSPPLTNQLPPPHYVTMPGPLPVCFRHSNDVKFCQ
jgi:hypothetical protein